MIERTETFSSPSGASHFSIRPFSERCCLSLSFRPLPGHLISQSRPSRAYDPARSVFVPFRGISFLNPVPHTPHFIRPHRVFCVGKPNRSILSFPNCLKIPANPVFKPCAGKYALPPFFIPVNPGSPVSFTITEYPLVQTHFNYHHYNRFVRILQVPSTRMFQSKNPLFFAQKNLIEIETYPGTFRPLPGHLISQ